LLIGGCGFCRHGLECLANDSSLVILTFLTRFPLPDPVTSTASCLGRDCLVTAGGSFTGDKGAKLIGVGLAVHSSSGCGLLVGVVFGGVAIIIELEKGLSESPD
uniref:Uncharacterized protein n=1 Tax=Amphimedon queenslandica TaxID=400682 RepID=A0A1X7UA43_AMPQE